MVFKILFQCMFAYSLIWCVFYRLTDWVNPDNLYANGAIVIYSATVLALCYSIETSKTK